MAITDITKPMALDETLQGTNTKMDAVILKLQGIIDALGLDTSVYKPKGNITCAALVPALLIESNIGNVYNVTDNGTTTSDFAEGAGKPIHVGDNVAIVDVGTGGQSEYKFDLLAGMVDLTNYVQKSATPGLLKNDGTIDTKDYAEKVPSATNGNLAGLNSSGNLTDSGISGDMTTTSATGNPISIADLKSAQIALNPVITFEPIQAGSGTSSPSNIRAISGYDKIEVLSCKKNIFDMSQVVAGGLDNDTGEETSSSGVYRSGWMRVKPNTTYMISGIATLRPFYYGQGKIFIERSSTTTGSTFTTPSGCGYVRFQIASSTWSSVTNPQVEEGTTATTYVPYHKTTDLSESLGQTQYWLEVDIRSGKAKIKGTQKIDLGNNLNWRQMGDYFEVYHGISNIKTFGGGVCECYKVTQVPYVAEMNNLEIRFNSDRFFIKHSDYQGNVSGLKSFLSGKYVICELETYGEIQLTPHEIALSQGYNYISTNGTSISLAYHNGELATHADVEQLAETVNELNDYLQRSNANSYVDLTTSTYQFPCDGYVVVDSQAVTSGNIRVQLIAKSGSFVIGGIFMHIAGAYQIQTTYVKAGMRARITQDVTGVRKRFIPLIP